MRTFSGRTASRVAVERDVGERRGAAQAPVFDRRVRVDHLRYLIGAIGGEDAVTHAIGPNLREICEWKPGGGESVVAGRGESLVERALSGAGDVRPHQIEDAAIVLVHVEAVMQELPQEAPALRGTEDIRRTAANGQVGAIPEC